MTDYKAKFLTGQIVHHKLFDYTGVVFDIDPFFQGSNEWYEQVAQSRPSKKNLGITFWCIKLNTQHTLLNKILI